MQIHSAINCPLCDKFGKIFHQTKKRNYYRCENCFGIFVDPRQRPNYTEEKIRYETHNNDVENENYQLFVSPITSAVMRKFSPDSSGLDFGAGTGPVISKILIDKNYQIVQYDPFFHNYPELLNNQYDYIACCEVIEHFHNPNKEFRLLRSLLKEDGILYCMTHIYNEETNFKNWYYLNDLTHVFIYHEKTIHWIKKEFGFSEVRISDRLISFKK